MDETTSPEPSESNPNSFNWHLDRKELLSLSEDERAIYFNEKTSRLYEALTMLSRAEGAQVRRTDIEYILNPEEMERRHPDSDDIGGL